MRRCLGSKQRLTVFSLRSPLQRPTSSSWLDCLTASGGNFFLGCQSMGFKATCFLRFVTRFESFFLKSFWSASVPTFAVHFQVSPQNHTGIHVDQLHRLSISMPKPSHLSLFWDPVLFCLSVFASSSPRLQMGLRGSFLSICDRIKSCWLVFCLDSPTFLKATISSNQNGLRMDQTAHQKTSFFQWDQTDFWLRSVACH